MSDAARLEAVQTTVAVTLALIRFPKPTVAAVHGAAFGGGPGLGLRSGCSRGGWRLGFIFTQLGLPGGDMLAPWLLRRRVRTRLAWRLLSQAAIVHARQAVEMGLVDELVELGAELGCAQQWADGLARSPTFALKATKRQILEMEGAGPALDAYAAAQAQALAAALGSPEHAAAIRTLRQSKVKGLPSACRD
jgi:enoyl-CoA hydratase/carnithine racemase